MNKAVFLDRDGVINEDTGYVFRSSDVRFMPGIFDFCRKSQEKGYQLIIVTNQSGIARGFYSEESFQMLNDWMCKEFQDRGVVISRVYYCPFHPTQGIGKYRVDSFDRKPNPGMLFKARDELGIALQSSIVIGDRDSDMEAGRRAGAGTLLLLQNKYECEHSPDVHVIDSLQDAEFYL